MDSGSKYLVVLKDAKGRGSLVMVKAATADEAKVVAAQNLPKCTVLSVKNRVFL